MAAQSFIRLSKVANTHLSPSARTTRRIVPSERREVGRVSSLSPRGTFTVRAEGVVPEGTMLTDEEGRFRGRIVRVFGPVAHPYLAVAPRRPLPPEEALALVGSTLWTEVRARDR
jgi:rRNA processing protein Gar1